jgi:hypothetical protein
MENEENDGNDKNDGKLALFFASKHANLLI